MDQKNTTETSRNGADVLVDTLLGNGIDVCFANPGTSEMHFVAALDRKPQMRCILGLFEGVVTGAADGYARMAEKPACTLLHTGPGMANALANMHNARRAHTPMVNIVGDHASYHLQHDAPLTSDIESLARPMSRWVGRVRGANDVAQKAAQAIHESTTLGGGVATLILPADAAWSRTSISRVPSKPAETLQLDESALRESVKALESQAGAKTLIMLSGRALREDALAIAQSIAERTGAHLLAQQSNARTQRGRGRVSIERIPYNVDAAIKLLAPYGHAILIGAKAPVAFFAYPQKPGSMLPPDCGITELSPPGGDALEALTRLADAVGAADRPRSLVSQPRMEAAGDLSWSASTPINALTFAQAMAELIPEGAIVCDESVSSGRDFFRYTMQAAPHDYLQITGGAIGSGIPLATGAAVACPDRKVVLMQADGSAMYTLQGLWTQARERLDVLNIIISNRTYAILRGEFKSVGAGTPGKNACQMLDLDNPALDWLAIAKGCGLEAVRVSSIAEFGDAVRAALARKGPFLIEAVF